MVRAWTRVQCTQMCVYVGMNARACQHAGSVDVYEPARQRLVNSGLIIDDRNDIGAIIVGMPSDIRNYCGGADCSSDKGRTTRIFAHNNESVHKRLYL